MKRYHRAILILISLGILDSGWAQPLDKDLSLRGLVKVGLERSLSIRSQLLKQQQVSMKKWDSYASLLPALSLSAGQTWSKSESESAGVTDITASTTNSLKISGSWSVWDHGANITKIRTSGIDEDSEKLNTDRDRQAFIYNLIDQYLDYLLLVRQRELAKRYLDQSTKTYDEAKTMMEAGAKTQIEAMDSEIAALDAERNLMEAEASLKNSERSLRALLNLGGDDQIPVLNILEVEPYYREQFEKKISELKKITPGQRVELSRENRIASLDLEKSLIELKQTRWNYWPQVKIGAAHEWDFAQKVNDQSDGTTPVLQASSVYLTISWTVFDWFTSTRSLTSSEYDFQIKSNSYSDSRRKAIADSENMIEQYDILKKSVDTSKLSLAKTKRQLENSRELHRLGRINLLMMQQSTSRYFEAEAAYASRLKSLQLIMAQILIKSGSSIDP